MAMVWSAQADELLLQLWNDGGSLEKIATEMQRAGYTVTRNSISGRKHRLKGWRQGGLIRPANSYAIHTINPSRTRPRKLRHQRSKCLSEDDKNDRPPEKPVIKPLTTVEEMQNFMREHEGTDYLATPGWGCKAIMSGRTGEWGLARMCGRMRIDCSPYCRIHQRLYTNGQPYIRRSDRGG